MAEDVPFRDRDDEDSIDDILDMMASALQDTEECSSEEIVHSLVSKVFEERGDDIGVLGNFVFIGEIINADGEAQLMVVTSDNLPEWVSRGMIMTADDYLAIGNMGFMGE